MTPTLVPTADGFLREGARHVIISGALHYSRVHPDLWRDRLRRIVALGCTTVETYVPWNLHEPRPGQFRFEGIADLERFLRIAHEEGLDAIVRPGPYVCGEWENGGFPGWLLRDTSMRLRSHDPAFLAAVDAWWDVLIPRIARHQRTKGGNVIMVQVENEYGSYRHDPLYMGHLRDGLRERGIDELLVTSDGPGPEWLSGGTVDGALATVNFGSRTREVLTMAERELPAQPLMCMEFWCGWFDHWGDEAHHVRDSTSVAEELDVMLSHGMSVNFYMAHGGTNFGLWAGANWDGGLQPTTTSYDYDAPIAEDGTLTDKFLACREVIAQHVDLPPLDQHLEELGLARREASLEPRELTELVSAPLVQCAAPAEQPRTYPQPPSFEALGLERGMMRLRRRMELGRARLGGVTEIPPLRLYDLHDLAWVWVDGLFMGEASAPRDGADCARVPLEEHADALLGGEEARTVDVEIWVASLGRVNFGPRIGQHKGILGGIWHGVRFVDDWEVSLWPLDEMGEALAAAAASTDGAAGATGALPAVVSATFEVGEPRQTYLEIRGGGHGVAFINGWCLGRYWHVGPQQTLYVPAPVVRSGTNILQVVEYERQPDAFVLTGAAKL